MVIYVFPLILLTLFSSLELLDKHVKNQRIIFVMLCILLLCISGFRYGLETDYWHYYYIFHGILKASNIEIAYTLLNKIIYAVTHNFNIFCFIIAIVSMGLKGWIFDKMKYPFMALLCYYLRFYVLFELNAIRQGLAITFILLAYIAIDKKNIKKYIVFSIIAILFHSSAIVIFIAPILKKMNLNAYKIVIIYMAALIFRIFLFDQTIVFLQGFATFINGSSNGVIKGTQYIINSGDKMQSFGILNYIRIILPGLALYYLQKKDNKPFFYNIYFWGSIINIMFLGLDTIGFRLASNFYVVECFILCDIINSNVGIFRLRKFKLKQALCFGAIAFCDIWSFVATLISSSTLIPYTTFIFTKHV